MTKDEALKMAIEVMNDHKKVLGNTPALQAIINACKEALEQPDWQGLTDDEIAEKYKSFKFPNIAGFWEGVRWAEQAHGIGEKK